ncbi:MAG TPA: hypothetical protein VLL52_07135 [Anaerolineae bacterium]|nr:hypothetical protein [Anaerolineae bacterium]
MSIFTFHLAKSGFLSTVKAVWRPPTAARVAGLEQAECMMMMKLGSPILSPSRMQLNRLAMFAKWESESAIDDFLSNTEVGGVLNEGWHVRLEFLRRWGHITEFDGLPEVVEELDPAAPVVAVTLARMKLPQVPRFIRWGWPVEGLVRDHPGTTLALAAIRLPRTVSTFSVWRSQQEMIDMVRGHSSRDMVPEPKRHVVAMGERRRKDFHFEFTTLRFRAIGEYGEWEGRRGIVPSG